MDVIESFKLALEMYRHLTTLAATLLVIVGGFTTKAFPEPKAKWLVGAGMGFLMCSILFSVSAQLSILKALGPVDTGKLFVPILVVAQHGSNITLTLGILFSSWFALVNIMAEPEQSAPD